MSVTTNPTKRGNPNFKKKSAPELTNKVYRFQLSQSYENAKARDAKTGELAQNPYPAIYMVPNAGVAYNPDSEKMERWRFLHDYASIWVKDQLEPKPTPQQISDERNDLVFREGFLTVKAHETNKLDALLIQDVCEDVKYPTEDKTKVYRLVDASKELSKVRLAADQAYEAEKAARELSDDEMLPIAMLFGISIEGSDVNMGFIRTQFILKAKSMPETFLRELVNPKNKMKFVVARGIMKNIISTGLIEGQLVRVDSGNALMPINPEGDVPDQVASLAMAGDEVANKLIDSLNRQLFPHYSPIAS